MAISEPTRLAGDVYVEGGFSCGSFNPPSSSIDDDAIQANAKIAYTKVVHEFTLNCAKVAPATTITAFTELIHIVRGANATVVAIKVACVTAPTGDHTTTVDLKRSTGGGAFASILTGVVTLNSSSVALTPQSGTISSAALVVGDMLEVVVAVAGSTSSQGAGLIVSVVIAEEAN